MKLYFETPSFELVENVDLDKHIPLAYYHTEPHVYEANTSLIPFFDESEIRQGFSFKPVAPYSFFDSYEHLFFESTTSNPSIIEDFRPLNRNDYLVRVGQKYQFIPPTSHSFKPLSFNYSLIGKAKGVLQSNKTYDLNILCIEKKNALSDALIEIFADAPDKGLVPHNIWVNHKDLSTTSLQTGALNESDFLFIETTNGQHYAANNEKIPYGELLDHHVNIWLTLSELKTLAQGEAELKKQILFADLPNVDHYTFKAEDVPLEHLPPGGESIYLFEGSVLAALVKHYPNKGFIILTSKDFVLNAKHYYRTIYEILMQIYIMSYTESETYLGYVTDYDVDYDIKYNRIHPHQGLRSSFNVEEMIGKNYDPTTVKCDSPLIRSQINQDYIFFSKVSEAPSTDPVKPFQYLSAYLDSHEIIYFSNWSYLLDQFPKCTMTQNGTELVVIIEPFVFSSYGISFNERTILKIPLRQIIYYNTVWIDKAQYVIYYENGMLKTCLIDDYENQGRSLFYLNLQKDTDIKTLIDMRLRGGGLPKHVKEEDGLFDIGHMQGKPIRKSGTLLVFLPEAYKPYHDRIQTVLRDYIVSEKHFMIFYE